jgi:hypothetical protein
VAGFSLKKKIGNLFSAAGHGLNPFDGGQGWTSGPSNQQRAAQSIQNANQQIQNIQAPKGVLVNPQVRQQFVSSQVPSTLTKIDVGSVLKNRATGLGLGSLRAGTGWVQGGAGLYDLATPGTGTNRFSQGLNKFAQSIDQTAKAENVGNIYTAGQVGTEGLGFAAPSMLADALGKTSVVSKVSRPITKANTFIDNLANVPKTATSSQRITARAIEGLRPSTLLNVTSGVASDLGQITGKGQDINLKNTALSVGANVGLGVGVPVVGQIAAEGAKKAGKVSVKGAKAVATAVEDPRIAELRNRNEFLQKSYDTAPEPVRKTLNKQIASNNVEINTVKQNGSIGLGGEQTPNTTPVTSEQLTNKIKNIVEPPAVKPGEKVRKFQENIDRVLPNNPTAKEVVESIPGYKPITNKRTLSKAADAIAENPQREFAKVVTKSQLTSANDVATGNLLLRDAIEKGDVETAIQLGTKLGIDGTKLGQAVQAYATFKKTTPEGIVTYASKKAMRAGKELDQATASQLIDQAKTVAQMEEGLDKAKATRDLLSQANSVGRSWKDTVAEVLAAPRSAMATADLSAPLRQGAVLGTRYPKQFGAAFVDSIKYFANPKLFEKEMYDISQRSTYPLMKKSRLAVEGANGLTSTEEMFMNSILEGDVAKKLGFGRLVAASDRAYSGFLTKLRADVFDKVVSDFNSSGVKLDAKATDSLAKFINSASGRGSGKTLDKYGGLLAQVLFSPKLWKSRIDTMNPAYYARLDPAARKLALQSAATFATTATTILSLAAMAGAKVEQDPRSADFGKIRVGDTRYDILGGHQQNIRLAAQLLSGQKINSVTGQVQTLGPDRGFGKPSRLDLAYQFVENKENPVVALATKALRGTDQTGNPINIGNEAAKLAIPLNLQSTWETARNVGSIPKGVAMNVPGTFGVGVQTYGKEKAPAGTPVSVSSGGKKYSLEQKDDGKYSVTVGDKVLTRDNLKDARDVIARDSFKGSGDKSRVIGDTFYYKTKTGDIKSQPKVIYESKQSSAKNKLEMDRAYGAKDISKWVASAQNEIDNLVNKQSFYDPITEKDEIDKIQLQIENLTDKAVKYASKGMGGGSRRSSGGSKGNKSINLAYTKSPISVSVRKSPAIKKPNVRVAVKARSSGGKGGKIKLTSKKVRLA